jgi:hypothetical protein
MSGQPQSQFPSLSAVVQDLETKLVAPGKKYDLAPIYYQLCQDAAVILAVRHLALGAIANRLNLYSNPSAASILVDEVSGRVHGTDPDRLLMSIQHLKAHYPSIYRLNTLSFDRFTASAEEFIDRHIAQGIAPVSPEPSSPQSNFVQPLAMVNNIVPAARINKTILIGGAIMAGAIVAGTFFTIGRHHTLPTSPVVVSPISNSPLASIPSTVGTVPLPSVSIRTGYIPAPVSTPLSRRATDGKSTAPISVAAIPSVLSSSPIAVRSTPQPSSSGGRSSSIPAVPAIKISSKPSSSMATGSTREQIRPQSSTNSFISQYYGKLKRGQHQSAWLDLAPRFQNNRQANPGGYKGQYSKWWSSRGQHTQLDRVETVKATATRAIVRVHCRFSGEAYVAEYHLAFDKASRSWKIDKIKKLS